MPDWLQQAIGPIMGGAISGLIFLGGIRAEMRATKEMLNSVAKTATRAHVRIDDHIDKHHVGVKS